MRKEKLNIGNWFLDQLAIYQTANSDYQSVKNNFVIRKNEYESIIASIKSKKENDPLQHELILGRRGSGKSTLLKRIEIEVVEQSVINQKFVAINLAEEQAGIYRLFDLWEQIIYELNKQPNFNIQLPEFSSFENNETYTRELYKLIHEACNQNKKRIVLLLDNIDRILENFNEDGALLREELINHNDIQIIGGSTRMSEHFWRYDLPFYNFFRTHRLEALTREEMHTLLEHWSNLLGIDELKDFVKHNPGKIENIRLLTDGLPRTLQFFIQIVLQNSESNTYDYLKKTMDNVSPLYQERLNSLPAQLRKTVYEMAFIWEACTTKQLVEKLKMESKLISANLKTLVEKGIVSKIETNKKQHLYRISERFFNMWLIVTQGNPEQKRKAKWLSIFLENWYNASDFRDLTKRHIDKLKSGKTDWNSSLIFSKALSQSKFITTKERDTILSLMEKLGDKEQKECLLELPEKYETIYKDILELRSKDEFEKAILRAESIENEEDGVKFFLLGVLYQRNENVRKAKNFYLKAIDKGQYRAYTNLGNILSNEKKYKEAEMCYLEAFSKGDTNALVNLALTCETQKKFIEAEDFYNKAIKHGNKIASNNLAVLYMEQQKFKKAEIYFLEAIRSGDDRAYNNLGNLYIELKNYDRAEIYLKKAIIHKDENALNNLAAMYYELNKEKQQALTLINEACETMSAPAYKETQLITEIWNGIFNNIEKRSIDIIKQKDESVTKVLLFDLLVQNQKNTVLNLFNNAEIGNELKEQFTVLHYVTLILVDSSDNNLLLKIPPELKSTIEEVIAEIKEQQRKYES